jgi:hypothetical protein
MELILTILDELAPQIIPEGLDPARQTLEHMAVASAAQRLTASQPRRALGILSFANNQAESKGIHLPAHARVLYLTEHRLDQMNPIRM